VQGARRTVGSQNARLLVAVLGRGRMLEVVSINALKAKRFAPVKERKIRFLLRAA
jgi:hypothetical protein